MKKLLTLAVSSMMAFSLFGCSPASSTETDAGEASDVTLEQVNKFLNTSADLGPGTTVNPVSVIPMKHIDGPKNNIDVYAFVNFEYEGRDFVKYQVSYISCTCRPAAVNYWNTAFVELSLPASKDPKDVVLKTLSYDKDSNGEYTGGMWADSDPIPSGMTYEQIKTEYVSHFEGKSLDYIKGLDTIEDIKAEDYQTGEGRENYDIDAFTGATVSTNNIIRMLNAVLDHHVENEFFK